MTSVFAINLKRGDQFTRTGQGTVVTMLSVQPRYMPYVDLFGRKMFRYWCSRADTGAEGWMLFSPTETVQRIDTPDDKYCPLCHSPVRYVITGNGAYWVHAANGQGFLNGHDVNTYAPDRLLDLIPPSYDS